MKTSGLGVKIFAKSTYDLDLIEKRLTELRSRQDQDNETRREIEYLEDLKRRKFPRHADSAV